jgi:hypothetical protein
VKGRDQLWHRRHLDLARSNEADARADDDRCEDQSNGLKVDPEIKVVTTAIAMPIMPMRLPRRLLSGLDSPLNARMKQTPEIR